jgi:FAD/FMN-containing dehydrogenase
MKTVTTIISEGIVPRALEAIDSVSLDAALNGKHNPLPPGTEAALIIELDGSDAVRVRKDLDAVEKLCVAGGCTLFRVAADEAERDLLWQARKGSYPAMARLAPDVLVEDGVVPRPRLPEALRETREILSKYKLTAGLVFHAGDGNLHPNIIFDRRDMQEVKRVKKAGYEILRSCIKLGGTISGEHGIGVEKRVAMSWLYGHEELDFFRGIKAAFDPKDLANPDKILPVASDSRTPADGQKQPEPSDFSARAALSPAARAVVDELRLRARGGARTAVTGLGTRLKPARIMEGARPLDLRSLNGRAEIDRENLTASVEAGVPFEEFRKQLKEAGLCVDLPDLKGSVGGLIASKVCPAIRETLLGLVLVTPEGALLELGGRTVKNVAGYDAVKLLCGSMGAYGVIISATFALSARARRAHAAFEEPAGWDAFEPDAYHVRIKNALDPRNLLNPWLYRGAAQGGEKI